MTVHHTSLIAAIKASTATTGVVVIHSHERNRCTTDQVTLLRACDALGLPVWFMAIDVFGGESPLPELVDVVGAQRRRELLNKGNNVFNQSRLHEELQERNISTLVILGEVLQSCVRMSIESKPTDLQGAAALDLGYHVRTSPLVLFGSGQTEYRTSTGMVNAAVQISLMAVNRDRLHWHTKL